MILLQIRDGNDWCAVSDLCCSGIARPAEGRRLSWAVMLCHIAVDRGWPRLVGGAAAVSDLCSVGLSACCTCQGRSAG